MLRELKTLDQAPKDKELIIKSIQEGPYRNKLYEMGFVPNQPLRILRAAPFGDPMAVELGNSTVMLRLSEARGIEIEELDS